MTAELNGRLLEILCCPITRRSLLRLDEVALAKVNAAIAAGGVRNHGGAALQEPLEDALVTSEGDLVYPVRSGVPILFEEECIHWAAFKHD
jgi:uncharacterized protein YbaR (Trm112 family)